MISKHLLLLFMVSLIFAHAFEGNKHFTNGNRVGTFRTYRASHSLQREVENIMGLKRMVEELDLDKTSNNWTWLSRKPCGFYRVAPLLIPHKSIETTQLTDSTYPINRK